MAPSAKYFSFLFLVILLSSPQIHARDSQLFSKFTHNSNNESVEEKEAVLGNKEESLSQKEQEPRFIPQTQNGYGLYGHESGQFPPTTTTNDALYTTSKRPYKTESEEHFNKEYYTTPTTTTNNNNYYYNKNAYEVEQQGTSGTSLLGKGYTTMTNQNNYYSGGNRYNSEQQYKVDNKYNTEYNVGNRYNTEQQYYSGNRYNTNQQRYNGVNGYHPEQQGMSDTRFLENGKYYFDMNSEKNYNNEYQTTRSRNGYNNRAYYGKNDNSFEGYQNQEEFQMPQDEFMP